MGQYRRISATLVIAALAAMAMAVPAGAQRSAPIDAAEEHCVVWASGVDENGELVLGDWTCGSGLSAAIAGGSGIMAFSTSFTIGRHFSSTGYSGSSVTIQGSSACGGGVWKPSGSWNNTIESSYHYCGSSPTRFYDSSSCGGTSKAIYSATSSLTWMNNRASCVRYG
ncbi:MAG: hypothetical protein AAGD18_03505 [Actinomycetota bacterium]